MAILSFSKTVCRCLFHSTQSNCYGALIVLSFWAMAQKWSKPGRLLNNNNYIYSVPWVPPMDRRWWRTSHTNGQLMWTECILRCRLNTRLWRAVKRQRTETSRRRRLQRWRQAQTMRCLSVFTVYEQSWDEMKVADMLTRRKSSHHADKSDHTLVRSADDRLLSVSKF